MPHSWQCQWFLGGQLSQNLQDRSSSHFHRVVNVFDRRLLIWPSFSDRSRAVAMATNFRDKMGEIGQLNSHPFVALTFQNRVEYCNSDFKRFICNDLATSCENMVRFGPSSPEFKKNWPIFLKNKLWDQLSQHLLNRFSSVFSSYGRYLTVVCWSNPTLFADSSKDVAMATNFR